MCFVKSENELDCMSKAFQIAELAAEAVIDEIEPTMTELQVTGIAQREITETGESWGDTHYTDFLR